ncbi:MAG: 30S ribosomal protein S9, partial [Firmicutes bacterium]|nr:30S ribosomal protein S9 [Bacillota bacterium]
MYEDKSCSRGTGRRKNAVARVRLYSGSGKITINGSDINSYFKCESHKIFAKGPFFIFENSEKFDVICRVNGGGLSGQAGAIRHGIARALNLLDRETFRSELKKAGFLTRDPR